MATIQALVVTRWTEIKLILSEGLELTELVRVRPGLTMVRVPSLRHSGTEPGQWARAGSAGQGGRPSSLVDNAGTIHQ